MDVRILGELGLTSSEIQVYLSLLELGASTAGAILQKSGLPNSTVHRDLNALIERGIVNFVLEGKRKVYQATSPQQFLRMLEDRKERVVALLPDLERLQQSARRKESATVYKGVRGIKEVYHAMLDSEGAEYNTFGGGPITAEMMGFSWWLNLHQRRIEKKLPSRQVFDESVRWGGEQIAGGPLTEIRYVDKEFAQFQETVIVGDRIAIAVFAQNPYAFMILDPHVAESYRKHFELLWKIAKP